MSSGSFPLMKLSSSKSADNAARCRTEPRLYALNCILTAVDLRSVDAKPNHTVPTGFSGVPPSGPAIPEMLYAASDPDMCNIRSAIARAVSQETAPCCSKLFPEI